jgi:hypothetical protein
VWQLGRDNHKILKQINIHIFIFFYDVDKLKDDDDPYATLIPNEVMKISRRVVQPCR